MPDPTPEELAQEEQWVDEGIARMEAERRRRTPDRRDKARLALLRRQIEACGFKVVDGEFVLTDGTRSTMALLPVNSMRLMRMAMQAREHEVKHSERAAQREFTELLSRSSIGEAAWIDCRLHGHTARDPYTHLCVECGPEVHQRAIDTPPT